MGAARRAHVDSTKIYAYLTIPEDAKLGVCAHETRAPAVRLARPVRHRQHVRGHRQLVPDGGRHLGAAGTPRPTRPPGARPQGWVTVVNQTTNATVTIPDVKASQTVYRLWKDGGGRQGVLPRREPPGGRQRRVAARRACSSGTSTRPSPQHQRKPLQGRARCRPTATRDLETNINRGDAGDPFPGSAGNAPSPDPSTPNSKSYAGSDTCVAVTNIPATATTMSVNLGVRCLIKSPKEKLKDVNKETARRSRSGRRSSRTSRTQGRPQGVQGPQGAVQGARRNQGGPQGPRPGKEVKEGKEIVENKFFDGGRSKKRPF